MTLEGFSPLLCSPAHWFSGLSVLRGVGILARSVARLCVVTAWWSESDETGHLGILVPLQCDHELSISSKLEYLTF